MRSKVARTTCDDPTTSLQARQVPLRANKDKQKNKKRRFTIRPILTYTRVRKRETSKRHIVSSRQVTAHQVRRTPHRRIFGGYTTDGACRDREQCVEECTGCHVNGGGLCGRRASQGTGRYLEAFHRRLFTGPIVRMGPGQTNEYKGPMVHAVVQSQVV